MFAAGIHWGTFSVGGSDSACYVYQADLWASGHLRSVDPLVSQAPWPSAARTLTPLGHMASKVVPGAIAPVCPAGLSIAMAPFVAVAGRAAAFVVVPLFGALFVVATFMLGRRFSARVGLASAALAACSPIFLFQLMQPMSDVPSAALWILAAALAADGRRGHAAWSGLATSGALLMRPNLLPMGAVIGLFLLLRPARSWQSRAGDAMAYAAACAPGCVAVLAVQQFFYGNPFESGYGTLASIFSVDNVSRNAMRYPRWLLTTHTPVVLLALVAPAVIERRALAWFAMAMVAANVACYLPYIVFEEWWYLRFLLPSIPLLVVLTVAVVDRLVLTTLHRLAAATLTVAAIALAAVFLLSARQALAFDMKSLESRFVRSGTYVAQKLPPNALLLAIWQSGSTRYYAGKETLIWDLLEPEWLDRTLAWLEAHGYEPYLIFESWEEPRFRDRFASVSPIGRLDWPPMAEVARQVRIYRPADRARYFATGDVRTDYAR